MPITFSEDDWARVIHNTGRWWKGQLGRPYEIGEQSYEPDAENLWHRRINVTYMLEVDVAHRDQAITLLQKYGALA